MKCRKALLLISLVCLLATVAGGFACSRGVKTKVSFLRDWDTARDRASSENKTIMVNFYTDA